MTTRMTMHTDARLLTLTQWLSPAFPVGAFAFSHGLEQAVAAGWVKDGPSLQAWLTDIAEHGSGWSDAVWLRLAYGCDSAEATLALNAHCRAFAPAVERLREGERQGRAFVKTTSEVWQIDLDDMQLPIALGRAARLLDLPIETVITLYLQSFLGNLVSAAQRLMPLGQTEAQGVLAAMNMLCMTVARKSQGATLDDISSTAFLSDIAAMRHETLQPRIFQT